MTAAEQLDDAWVNEQLAQAPPLSGEQRCRLAELLRPVRIQRDTGTVALT